MLQWQRGMPPKPAPLDLEINQYGSAAHTQSITELFIPPECDMSAHIKCTKFITSRTPPTMYINIGVCTLHPLPAVHGGALLCLQSEESSGPVWHTHGGPVHPSHTSPGGVQGGVEAGL